ncbi:MAG: ABC transporter substrate-binding protein [Propionibacterium sp.]|nr:ABC transporter substrate-binding protein [Propionibacterium sp.]
MINIYDTLVRYDPEQREVVPQLAESLEPNDDFTVWTLTLRPGTTFSDGSPFDAEAVVGSFDRYANSESAPDKTLWNANVQQTDVMDDTTVEIVLAEPWPGFVNLLASGPGMIVGEGSGEGDGFTPIGAGPFTVESVKPGEETVLAANPNYWDGEPYLDRLRIVYYENPITSAEALESGDVQAIYNRDPNMVEELLAAGYPGFRQMVAASNVALINAADGHPGADVRVRQAMQLAIDPQILVDRAFQGKGLASTELFPEYSRWHGDEGKTEHDPTKAAELLEEAKSEGFDGKIEYFDGADPQSRDIALAVEAQLEAVGFEVNVTYLRAAADQITTANSGSYDVMGWGHNYREFDPYPKMFATIHSQGNQTYGAHTSSEMDAAIEAFKAASTEEEQQQAMNEVSALYNEQVPFLNWGPFGEHYFWAQNVYDVQGAANSMVIFGKAWIQQ